MRVFFTLTLLFLGCSLYAQESSQEYARKFPGLKNVVVDTAAHVPIYKYRSVGLSYKTIRDRALSPLLFEGPGVSYSALAWKYNKNWLWQQAFSTQGFLMLNEPGESLLSELGFNYRYTALRELTSLQKNTWQFWVGPEAQMLLNMRIHSRNTNNIGAYDWATTVGASAMVSKSFRLFNRDFIVSNQVHLPLVFVYARPAYAWGTPPAIYEEQEGAWKEAFEVGTFNTVFLMSNQLNLDFYRRKRKQGKLIHYKAYRVSYSWNYFQVSTKNNMQSGGYTLSISRVLTF